MKAQISERFYNSDQSWVFERIVADHGNKLRVLIRRNSYDAQSYVRGYALDRNNLQWNLLVDRPIQGATCEKSSYVESAERVNRKAFEQDAESVLGELRQIIS